MTIPAIGAERNTRGWTARTSANEMAMTSARPSPTQPAKTAPRSTMRPERAARISGSIGAPESRDVGWAVPGPAGWGPTVVGSAVPGLAGWGPTVVGSAVPGPAG